MRDLLKDPACAESDLGVPLPDSPHACSVCLPSWQAVVDYEEGRDRVLRKLRSGYPRFVFNPIVETLRAKAATGLGGEELEVFLFPNREAAQRAMRFVEMRHKVAARVVSYDSVQALLIPKEVRNSAFLYWRYAGEVLSSRQAQDLLKGTETVLANDELGEGLKALAKLLRSQVKDLFVYESGMGGIAAVHRLVTKRLSGKRTLQMEFPYTDAFKVQENFGSGVMFLPDASGESFSEALGRIRAGEFAAVFCEIPSNPLLRCLNLQSLSEACRDSKTPLVLDDTVASCHHVDVIGLADIVTTSLTKWFSGAGDVMAGAVRLNPESLLYEELAEGISADNPNRSKLYAADWQVLQKNLKGFEKRMEISSRGGEMVADYLENHSAVEQVWYPKFTTKSHYEAVRRKGSGYGGMLSFALKNAKRTPRFYDQLRWNKGPSLGAEFSLACPYTLLAHYHELEWAESCGVTENLIRLSIGVEDAEDLISRLGEALAGS